MVRGRKITKKKLKEPDEFISLTAKTLLFFTHHLKFLAAGGIIVLIIGLGIFIFLKWENKKETEAYQKFGLAERIYQTVSSPYQQGSPTGYKNALEKFNDVIVEFPGTPSGRLSLLYKGNIHLKLGEFDEAIKAYETFLQKAGKEKLIRLFAMEGLGYAYEGKKDYEKALHAYQKILELDSSSQLANAYLSIGRCYEKLGKNKEALENYKAFLKINQKSMMANTVTRKISHLEK
jgi:tetratricopeptide (TPR) repeat protein